MRLLCYSVMPGFMPGIHVFLYSKQDVDGRDEPGHDVESAVFTTKVPARVIKSKKSR
jgi:hypothetical protein